MDHESNMHQPSLELPAPRPEQSRPAHGTERQPEQKSGQRSEKPHVESLGSPPPVVPVLPVPDDTQVADDSSTASVAPIVDGTPAIADDADLIEQEWVDKAKEIVARTKDDPYQQNKEINRVKADYLKKRYNKDLKISTN